MSAVVLTHEHTTGLPLILATPFCILPQRKQVSGFALPSLSSHCTIQTMPNIVRLLRLRLGGRSGLTQIHWILPNLAARRTNHLPFLHSQVRDSVFGWIRVHHFVRNFERIELGKKRYLLHHQQTDGKSVHGLRRQCCRNLLGEQPSLWKAI